VPGDENTRLVRHFRQILLWPLQLMPIREGAQIQKHWELLQQPGPDNPWREVGDEFTGDPTQFQERHYNEFVTFLPFVQRFLYGEGKGAGSGYGESPIRVYRRSDVARVRMTYPDAAPAITFEVAHVDLYFFFDIDVVVLVVEIHADDLPLARAQETLYRFGRGYPTYWEADGNGGHCMKRVEWLAGDGSVLAGSDFENREKYLSFVCRHRAPCIASHWEFLLSPLALHHSDRSGPIRYRQVEYHRMPLLAFLAVDDAASLSRADFVRLGLVSAPGSADTAPYSDGHLRDFERRYCYDRYWTGTQSGPPGTRFLCCGHALVIVGDQRDRFVGDRHAGLLQQFRHQYFLLFLVPHFHKAALLMMSDRLVDALNRLDIHEPESVKRFKRAIRQKLEIFLRFTHRYWFHEVSDQAQVKDLYHMCQEFLGTDRLYADLRAEIWDMSQYLDSDSLRRQANTVVRLTVVTTFGLIGTVTTGLLGMNLIAEADSPVATRWLILLLTFVPIAVLTLYTVIKSKRLSDFLEALSDERLSNAGKFAALLDVWRSDHGRRG